MTLSFCLNIDLQLHGEKRKTGNTITIKYIVTYSAISISVTKGIFLTWLYGTEGYTCPSSTLVSSYIIALKYSNMTFPGLN